VKESNVDITVPGLADSNQSESDVHSVLSSYKSDGDPNVYQNVYADIQKFVDTSMDTYKYELGTILYPVFVHMYLELVYNGHEEYAIRFMDKFKDSQESYYQDDIKKISYVTKREHMRGNELADTFK